MGDLLGKLTSYFKIRYAIMLVPVCGFAIYDSVFQSFSSILGVLRNAYPDVPVTAIQMILALPPMVSIPGTLLAGFLAAYIHKKRLAEFALAIIFVGGMIPVVFPEPSIYAMFACSACIGVGQGFLHPLANAIICQRWEDDSERSRVLGFKQCFNYLGEVLVTLCVGFLALARWGNAFLVYLGVIPVFLVTHFCLPKGELDKRLIDREHRAEGLRDLLRPRVVYLFVLFFFAMMCLYGYYTNIALLVQERSLGTTADIAGISSTISIASLVLGALYGLVSKRLGRFTLTVGFGLLACGMLVVSLGVSLPMIVAGGILIGLGVGIQQISTVYYISKAVNPRLVTLAVSIALSCISLGASLAPLVIGFVNVTVLGAQTAAGGLMVSSAGYLVLMLVEGGLTLCRKRAHDEDDHEGLTPEQAADMAPEED
ncbi:MFS transporter [Adlercreutzia faecimuris]|uniref:MFS transporter n=1 Tax=Adlercreutzia faecimuris TaxID=2897341 RepID=A0ABS9WEQ5_9ACTN|nr:MFS transporter [Adlercreutzia sp. JBNU-10]MCI2241265.1 MFS transporter [Adlercreutzia sp. JBNU-10]